MLRDLLVEKAGLPWTDRVIIYDTDDMVSKVIASAGDFGDDHTVCVIHCAEELRYIYERDYRSTATKAILVLPNRDILIPYDISRRFAIVVLGFDVLFPQLDATTLRAAPGIDFDFLAVATKHMVGRKLNAKQTKQFYTSGMFSQATIDEYAEAMTQEINARIAAIKTYKDWCPIIDSLSKLMLLRDKGFHVELQPIYDAVDNAFRSWTAARYASLASTADISQPVMLHHVPDFVRRSSSKPAVVVIDGMSFIDWQVIREYLVDAPWRVNVSSVFSFLPSVTSIARQSLFSGKVPVQNTKPFSLADEEKQWRQYWTENGLRDDEIFRQDQHLRYQICWPAGIVVNFIDDLMHRQLQGTLGMAVDINTWLKNGALRRLIENLMQSGFDVFITADHGHTEATGKGRFSKPGLLTEDASRRAVIYKDFAGAEELDKFKVTEYAWHLYAEDLPLLPFCKRRVYWRLRQQIHHTRKRFHRGIARPVCKNRRNTKWLILLRFQNRLVLTF